MRAGWPTRVAAAAIGAALGIAALAGGALLLYSGDGFLESAGLLMAITLAATAAGVWAGSPEGDGPRRVTGRWMAAILALVAASFLATAWLRLPALQTAAFGPSLGVILFLGAPGYALGALLAALHGGRRGGVVAPALLGAAAGIALAASWLIPALPPGPVFFGAALLLTGSGTAWMALEREATVGSLGGSVVLVTGAGKAGQAGFAVARAFRDAGARVVVAARSAEEASARASELGADAVGVVGGESSESLTSGNGIVTTCGELSM